MKSLKDFIKAFLNNDGQHVFISLLVAKICAFSGSLFMIRILSEKEFGMMSIVASVFAIFAPFSGFGSPQSLIRFGSLCGSEEEKKELSAYLFRKGFFYQLALSIVFFLLSFLYVSHYYYIFYIFFFFTIRLMGFYFLSHIQSNSRIYLKNKEFATVNNVINISGLLMMIVFSFFWGLYGYLIAIAIAPFLSLFWYKESLWKIRISLKNFTSKEIWNFALHASATALLSDALFSADILLLSFFTNENAVANYKVALLIPSNIIFLALSFMQSDYPILAQNYRNKTFLTHYIINYYKIFVPISLVVLVVGYFLSKTILQLFFGAQYTHNSIIFSLLLAAFCGSMLLRNLYGNLLSAVGLMKMNTLYSALSLILLGLISYFLVPEGGVKGMAVSMTIVLTVSGLLMMLSFLSYLKNLK
ncbi:oligosaccharide flippase family protein [Chryseobacterium sp. PMSZPI]|uniref:oligosaccharide flippase family protein n=1 Tax=Chryseobacterium sp. PMSZPI TaxID=1033900 RepID=UPI000C323F50|nr:oligosaccharide flippase family protein [Chryseobacterium sp. PMSZPI]PKF72961.1 polysaccharide biosynthesis protein [Chryseobacterium sp. PMSZPI]